MDAWVTLAISNPPQRDGRVWMETQTAKLCGTAWGAELKPPVLERYRTRKKRLNHCPLLFYKLRIYQRTGIVGSREMCFMNTGICKGLDTRSWKDLYQAAMFEPDLNKLPERIADAETALVMRRRELSTTSDDRFEEKESLDDAMCILHALRSSLKRRPTAVRETNRVNQLLLSAGF